MNFALIGNGFIGQRHIDAIAKAGGKLVAVCDIDESRRVEGVDFFTDYKEAINLADAVAICTPNHLHVPIASHCLSNGKKVLSEKPLGISSDEINLLPSDGSVFTVLQLRHHPEVIKLKKSLGDKYHEVEMSIVVHRTDSYWSGWKGDSKKSGGILMNIGIHYFDLLLHFFGFNYEIESSIYNPKYASGIIKFPTARVSYKIAIIPTQEGQDRILKIDGNDLSLSNKDNLSYEDLHTSVYDDFIKGVGVLPKDAFPSIKLVEELINSAVPPQDILISK